MQGNGIAFRVQTEVQIMSNIGKRFSEPAVWEKPFFTGLDINQRLFWLYLNNRCDLAGVYQLHFPVDSAYLGFKIDNEFINDFLQAVNSNSKRLELIDGHRLWLINFVRYQQTGKKRSCLSANSPPHISVVGKLKEHELLQIAVEKDPELYKEFTGEVPDEENNDSLGYAKGKATLSEGYSKGYSSSNSSINGSGNSDSSNTDVAINEKEALNPKPSLFYRNIVKQLKKIIPEDCIGVSDQEMESNVEVFYNLIEKQGISEPSAFLIGKARTTDWEKTKWRDFDQRIMEGIEAGAPF